MSQSNSKADHLAWCKERALAYLDHGDLVNALASMASDMRKHPETDTRTTTTLLSMEGFRCVTSNDAAGMRRLIEGFR
jgi:hypothetical protein